MSKQSIATLIIAIFAFSILLVSCDKDTGIEKCISKFVNYSKKGDFDRIDKELISGPAKESYKDFVAQLANDSQAYETVLNTYKSVRKIELLQVENYDGGEVAAKFQLISKDGTVIDSPWWRFKIDGKNVYIIKFSKH